MPTGVRLPRGVGETSRRVWANCGSLIGGGFQWPRAGQNNDKAHPPIHPVNYVSPSQLNGTKRRCTIRLFGDSCMLLNRCQRHAYPGRSRVWPEVVQNQRLIVLERNYLDVYPYDKWESSQELPEFAVGDVFVRKKPKWRRGRRVRRATSPSRSSSR